MSQYSKKARGLIQEFESCEITQIPRTMNEEVDALAKLATQGSASDPVPVIQIQHPIIQEGDLVFQVNQHTLANSDQGVLERWNPT